MVVPDSARTGYPSRPLIARRPQPEAKANETHRFRLPGSRVSARRHAGPEDRADTGQRKLPVQCAEVTGPIKGRRRERASGATPPAQLRRTPHVAATPGRRCRIPATGSLTGANAKRWNARAVPETESRGREPHPHSDCGDRRRSLHGLGAIGANDVANSMGLRLLCTLVAVASCAPGVRAQAYTSVVVFGDSLSDAGQCRRDTAGRGRRQRLYDQSRSGLGGDRGGDLRCSRDARARRRIELRHRRYLCGPRRRLQLSGTEARPANRRTPVAAGVGGGRCQCPVRCLGGSQRHRHHRESRCRYPAGGPLEPPSRRRRALWWIRSGALQHGGARHILVFNLPDRGPTPGVRAAALDNPHLPAALAGATTLYNEHLDAGIRTLGDGIVPVNAHALFTEVLDDPARHGFANVHDPACSPAGPNLSSVACGPSDSGSPLTYPLGTNRSHSVCRSQSSDRSGPRSAGKRGDLDPRGTRPDLPRR